MNNLETLRKNLQSALAKLEENRSAGKLDHVIAGEKIIALLQDEIYEAEKDKATNRDGATD